MLASYLADHANTTPVGKLYSYTYSYPVASVQCLSSHWCIPSNERIYFEYPFNTSIRIWCAQMHANITCPSLHLNGYIKAYTHAQLLYCT